MDADLKAEFIHAMIRFRKVGMPMPPGENIRMGEIFILGRVSAKGASMTEIQNNLFMTKPAVSQTLNTLEKRGLIRREIDQRDRRRIMVTLTEKGRQFLQKKRQYTDHFMEMTLARFGQDNAKELIRLLNQLADITEEIKQDAESQPVLDNLKGDEPIDETR